jgi:hypothetical protein
MPTEGWEISPEREALFEMPEGISVTDQYLVLGKQMEIAKPHELGALYMMRSKDREQQEAMVLVQSAKTMVWTRRAVVAALIGIPVNGLITFLVTFYASR